MHKALLVCDFINDIVHPDGKLAKKGYSDYVIAHHTIQNTNKAIQYFRQHNDLILFVKIAFSPDYKEQPKQSPLFGKAHEYGVLATGTRGTEFHAELDYQGEPCIIKHRVSPFYATNIDVFLKSNDISHVYIAGCATDLVVEATARDAHDRDYTVTVLADCCAAASETDHQHTLTTIQKIGTVSTVDEIIKKTVQ